MKSKKMKIGLIDVDGHGKKKKWGATIYPNLALAKIAAWHKAKGDAVSWYDPMFTGHCDIVYMSKVFNFSPDYDLPIDADIIKKGGTGYDIAGCLPQEVDDTQPDLSIYPGVPNDTSYGFLTRGCPNKCKWCVVPRKEGHIHPYWDIERVANGRPNVVLMDNNILAAGDYAVEQLEKIIWGGGKWILTKHWMRALLRLNSRRCLERLNGLNHESASAATRPDKWPNVKRQWI